MTAKKKSKKKFVYRSAVDGKIVTKKFAELNPDTTVKEIVKKKQ